MFMITSFELRVLQNAAARAVVFRFAKFLNSEVILFMKKLIYAEGTSEIGSGGMFEGPATPEPRFRWFTCRLHKTYATKKELKKLL